jgi:FkbH-like protein
LAAEEGVHVLAIDAYAQEEGIRTWHDPALWNRAKQEIHPRVSHLYGDLVGRLLAALRGCSSKCLVLDLDNTLWGGVIGDDGLEGILLGQGSAMGEAFLSFQRYVLELSTRGIILAVCSKNDEVNAVSPFEQHPEMILRRKDVACFVANWRDKAANLKHIAETLNIGLDSLVFVDDDPAERALVRQELPMVSVPELSDDPSEYFQSLSDSGYFEALTITAEDRARCQQYQANTQRDQLRKSSTDMAGYLASMEMELQWKAFDSISVPRIVQLMNKTNQFNLTTKRYSSADVTRFMNDPHTLTFEFRLIDRFGDNGIIAVVIGCLTPRREFVVDTWLMSCRVLGRKVEETMLNVIGTVAIAAGAKTIVGHYRPTLKNGMVREHYQKLHFDFVAGSDDGSTSWSMDLGSFSPKRSIISVEGI